MDPNQDLALAAAALPHGPTFRFIDQLESLQPGISGSATYLLHGNEAFLSGHFPSQPLFPGVLMIEAVAQLAGIVAQNAPDQPRLNNLRLTAVNRAKILGTIAPGNSLSIEATITGRLGGLIQAEGSVSHNNQSLLKTQITLSGDLP